MSVDVTVGPLSDAGGSGLAADPLTVETSTNGGSTWSAEAPAASATVSDEGDTLVRFRSHDAAGNVSLWAQAEVRIDRTAPSDPSLAGGSASWFDSASMLVSASGATDTPGSGIDHYEYETSTDGGSTWSSATSGATASITAEGETVLRFRASRWRRSDLRVGAGDRAARPHGAVRAVGVGPDARLAVGRLRVPPPRAVRPTAFPASTTTSTRSRPTAGRRGVPPPPATPPT